MSNILIIKHGSLGDIAQASGAVQDIYYNHKDDFIYLLTSHTYSDLFKKNPNIKEVIVDKRLSCFNPNRFLRNRHAMCLNKTNVEIKVFETKIGKEPMEFDDSCNTDLQNFILSYGKKNNFGEIENSFPRSFHPEDFQVSYI